MSLHVCVTPGDLGLTKQCGSCSEQNGSIEGRQHNTPLAKINIYTFSSPQYSNRRKFLWRPLLNISQLSKVRDLIHIVLSIATEFQGNLLKMSVSPCCPHIPASSVSAMLNEINFLRGALELRTKQTMILSLV